MREHPVEAPEGRRSLLRRIAIVPVAVVTTAVVLLDEAFRAVVLPVVARIARWQLVRRAERWIGGLPRFAILALFLVPVAILEPLKLAGLYLLGTGHLILGIGKVVGIGIAERIFSAGREKLLSIGWFRWCFDWGVRIKDSVKGWLVATRAWAVARDWARRAALSVRSLRARLRRWWGRSALAR